MEAGHREQHVPLGRVGMPRRDQPLDDIDHFADVMGRARFHVRRQRAQRGHIVVEVDRRPLRQGLDRDPEFGGAGVDLVLHVGDVPGIGHPRIQPPQHPGQHVIDDHGAGVADMHQVIHGGTTHVHPHMLGIERNEQLFPACETVVQVQVGHGFQFPLDKAAFSAKPPPESTPIAGPGPGRARFRPARDPATLDPEQIQGSAP